MVQPVEVEEEEEVVVVVQMVYVQPSAAVEVGVVLVDAEDKVVLVARVEEDRLGSISHRISFLAPSLSSVRMCFSLRATAPTVESASLEEVVEMVEQVPSPPVISAARTILIKALAASRQKVAMAAEAVQVAQVVTATADLRCL
jgi:hypothetical protein